ncbi:MAG: hypothetical protein ACK4TL_00005 [Hyphomicrobiaceae bacterium]
MLETGLVLGMTATHLGVPLADLMAWALVLALLVAPAPLDESRRQQLTKAAQRNSEVPGRTVKVVAAHGPPAMTPENRAVMPSATRLSTAEQWQTVSRLVSSGAERAMAVARDQQAIRRELDSLDFTLENLRRELATVMTGTLPTAPRGAALVPVRVERRPHALAA